ncbi:MAG: hypothetical protein ACLQUY_05605 [Ktedonobacterales bacterium]
MKQYPVHGQDHPRRRAGVLLQVDVAPNCYGGELASIIEHPTPELEAASNRLTAGYGFSVADFEAMRLQPRGSSL